MDAIFLTGVPSLNTFLYSFFLPGINQLTEDHALQITRPCIRCALKEMRQLKQYVLRANPVLLSLARPVYTCVVSKTYIPPDF
jgi:hypothetical protein